MATAIGRTHDLQVDRAHEIVIKLLDHCEMNCSMCGQLSQFPGEAISFARLEAFFGSMNLSGKRVYLWGGEPFLHRELLSIIHLFKTLGSVVALNTNGFTLHKHLDEVIQLQLDRLILSVDGINAATHDALRGRIGAFSRVEEAINLLNRKRLPGMLPHLRLNFLVQPENYTQILPFLEWARERSTYRLHFQLPMFVTEQMLTRYESCLHLKFGITTRNYAGFTARKGHFDLIDFTLLSSIMREVSECQSPFASFYPHKYLSPAQVQRYFCSEDHPINPDSHCDIAGGRLAIDSSGNLVTCPDFPDLSYGDLVRGITHVDTLKWARDQPMQVRPSLPCYRCCHFIPNTGIAQCDSTIR